MGHQSDLFALTIDDDLADDVRPFADPDAAPGDLTIFHYALPSPMTEAFAAAAARASAAVPQRHAGAFLRALPCRHLPPRLARPGTSWPRWPAAPTWRSATRRTTAPSSTPSVSTTPASSPSPSTSSASPTRRGARRSSSVLDDGPLNFLFVGRIVPNKKIEDHIRLAEVYKRYVDVELPLHLRRPDRRRSALLRHDPGARSPSTRCRPIASLHRRRCPTKTWPPTTARRSVYISLSEHEGFCVPLLEAMAADVPVLAYALTAVPTRSAAPACSSTQGSRGRRRAARRPGLRRAAARAASSPASAGGCADFGDARIQRGTSAALVAGTVPPSPVATGQDGARHREDCIRRSTLRRRDPRRIRVPLPADRRAAGRRATTSRC